MRSPLWVSGGRSWRPRERGGGVSTRTSKRPDFFRCWWGSRLRERKEKRKNQREFFLCLSFLFHLSPGRFFRLPPPPEPDPPIPPPPLWGGGLLFPPPPDEEEEDESDIVVVVDELFRRRQICVVVVVAAVVKAPPFGRLLGAAHAGGGAIEAAADVEGSEVPVRPRIESIRRACQVSRERERERERGRERESTRAKRSEGFQREREKKEGGRSEFLFRRRCTLSVSTTALRRSDSAAPSLSRSFHLPLFLSSRGTRETTRWTRSRSSRTWPRSCR